MILFRDDYDEAHAQSERYRHQIESAKKMTVESVREYLITNLTKEELEKFAESLKEHYS